MTNSTRCSLLAKQACTTLSHVVQKITPPSANNFLKLFFALFAMLALNVGNAWGAEATINFKEKGLENGVKYSDPFTIDANTTITFAGGDNDGKYYDTGTGIRTYGDGTITVECTNGTISEISFTWSGSNKPTADVATPAGYSTSTDKWTGSASSVTLTRPSGTGNWRLQEVTVTYETASGGENPGEGGGEPGTPGTGGESGSYTWDLSKKTYTTGTDEVTWTADGIATMHNAGTNATNYLGGDSNNRSSSRFYSNNTLTITPAANVTITSVEFTATSSNYATTLKNSTWNNATASVSGSVVTVTPTNGASAISATVGGTCGFTGVTVNYTKAASDEPEPVIVKTLKSIAVTPTTITYEQGDVFSFDGTCTATYSVTKDGVAQADETAEVTPTNVSTPDMNTIGTQTITVTYETVSTTYDITITENEVTAGTYNVLLNNELWNVTAGQQVASVESMTGKSNDITFYTTKGSSQMYASATQTRFYKDATFVISVPNGYVIKSIVFTEPGSDKTWNGSITVDAGSYDDDTKSWSGLAQDVVFTFGAQNRIAEAIVTYIADVKSTLTIETPQNGTISVKNGTTEVTSGTQLSAGTSLVVTPTPATGYVFESLTVDGSAVELTDGTYTFNMPATDVTISATFKENEKPAATLTLSKNGVEETFPGSWKQDDVVTLPSITSDCVKAFVGWSANASCATEPEYKAGDEYTLAETAQTLYAVYADAVEGGSEWKETPISDITATDQVVVTMTKSGTTYALFSGNETSAAPTASTIEIEDNKINSTIVDAYTWNIATNDGNYTLYPNGTTSTWLYCTDGNNGVRVGTNPAKVFTIEGNYLKHTGTSRYVGVYIAENPDWRCYTTTDGNIKDQVLKFYKNTPTYAYSNFSTTCAAAPKAEVNPTEVTATAAGVGGKVTVTYENVNTENVAVTLFNDEACTEAFTADWLTASLDGDKNITYTVVENTTYAERKAYIQLTAPETTGATDPAKVVIPVTQAGKEKVFASLAELVAADLTTGDEVTVTLNNDVIKEFYIYNSNRAGVVFDVQKDGKDIKIYFNNQTTIVDWAVGGKLSGTLTNVKWSTYSSAWQLAPDYNTWAWANLTYTEPKAVSTVVVGGAPTKTTYVDGEAFDPAGLTVTVNYNDATSEVNPTGVTFAVTPATLVKGQTSVSVTATYNSVTSAAYEVTDLTVNDIPTKTVAEFIEAGGTRCYLEGIVSNITNTSYGNFDLTDDSGTIYVYGCLNAAGESQKFAALGVKNGDKIKVIADEYELYDGTKDQATDVQYVSHISAATITIADITMEVGQEKTIEATITPEAAKTTVQYAITPESEHITLDGTTITAVSAGEATITATIAEVVGEYYGATKTFKVTVKPQNIAELPFEFTEGKADIENTLGMSQEGLGSDYTTAGVTTKLKFDDKGDWVIIHFNGQAEKLAYDIKGNGFSGGTFSVQESADGETYTDVVAHTELGDAAKEHELAAESRYVKFIYTEKSSGNVGLGNITISKADLRQETGLAWNPATVSLTVGDVFTAPTFSNPNDLTGITFTSDNEALATVNNAGAISLVSGKTGTATITATYAGNETYKPAEVKCTISVSPKTENVVILAQYAGNWYALKAEYVAEKTDRLAALPVEYINGTLYNVEDADKALITWERVVIGDKATFKNGDNYLKGKSSTTLIIEGETTGLYQWDYPSYTMVLEGSTTVRTFLYNSEYNCFRNYGASQASNGVAEDKDFSALPVVTAAKFETATIYPRTVTSGDYGTICLPYGSSNFTGAEFYEVAGKEEGKVVLDQVTTLEAGIPYIFKATANELKVVYEGEKQENAGESNGLHGTFTDNTPVAAEMYIVYDNQLRKCGTGCSINANRAYLNLEDVNNDVPAQMPGRKRVGMAVTGENGTTDVDNIVTPNGKATKVLHNGQIIIIRNGEKFNAQGQKL